jgi:1-acyl-sn-glycerol-3-phosphate acyltransferase
MQRHALSHKAAEESHPSWDLLFGRNTSRLATDPIDFLFIQAEEPYGMWNITVEGVMPAFWPPRPHPFWRVVLWPVRHYMLRHYLGIRELEVEGLDEFRKRFAPGDGVLIAPNHSHDADSHVMLEVGHRSGTQFYFMAAWQVFRFQWGLAGFLMQRLGAFSVDREGCDRRAVKQAIELLTTGQRLVVFPEGEIYHLNDRLTPLLDGVAFMALSAQRDLEKSRPDARVWVVPAAIRYRYMEDVAPRLEGALARMEQRFLVQPPPGTDLPQRVTRLGELLLTLKEKDKLGRARDSEGDLPSRLAFLVEGLLARLEQEWVKKSPEKERPSRSAGTLPAGGAPALGETVSLRVKALRRRLLDVYTDEKSDEATRVRVRSALDEVHLALQLSSYPGNYLREKPSQERIAETLQQLEEDMTNVRVRPLGRRRAKVILGEPIDLKQKMTGARARTLAGEVTDELEERMRQLMAREPWPTPAPVNPLPS